MCLIMTPAFLFYTKDNALSNLSVAYQEKAVVLDYLLGNVGFSLSICGSIYISNNGSATIKCETGLISNEYQYGVVPSGVETYSQPNSPFYNYYAYCGGDSALSSLNTNNVSIESCTKVALNKRIFEEYFNLICVNNASCLFEDFNKFFYKFPGNSSEQYCVNGSAQFFIQYRCKQKPPEILTKRRWALVVEICGIFGCLIFTLTVYYLKKSNNIENSLWELKTLSARRFTVELKIKEQRW